ncbi:DUF7343 domain-containing protein [Methanocaldococcus indicus]|uniref:helix-turn-helix transcriptional regulator n=1 Tax=Methanocaldococcus indicus TaxID=213231 RepID=UPI003C6D7BF8
MLLFLPNIHSSEIKNYEIKDTVVVCYVLPNNLVNETYTITLYNNDNKSFNEFSLLIPHSLSNITINSSPVNIKSQEIIYNEGATKITIGFDREIKPGESVKITYNFIVTDAIYGNSEKQLILNIPISSKKAKITIYLPPGTVILSPQGNLYIHPSGYTITSDGKHQIISWHLELNKPILFTINMKYTFVSFPSENNIENIQTNNKGEYWKFYVIIGLLLILSIGLGGLVIYKHNNERKLKNKVKEVDELRETINKLNSEILNLNETIREKEEKIKELDKKYLSKMKEVEELNNKINQLNNEINKLKEINEFLNYENEKLKDKLNEINKKLEEYRNIKKGILWQFLTDEEKEIIKLVKEYGEITQKEICEITGMNKPKVSRIVSELENRKILKKEKIGRINKIKLTEESEELL